MRAHRIAVLVVAGWITAMFVWVVGTRLAFPYELEWMCGAVLDTVARVRAGLPIYTAPTTSWIPFLYPPLYYWLGALLGGSALACRLLSLGSALVQAACVWRLARAGEASRYWATVGVLFFFASYFYVGYWFDLERSDTLCAALVLSGAVVATERKDTRGAVLAGALFGAAFFAKQQGLPFAVAAAGAFALDRAFRRAAALAGTTGAIVVVGTLLCDRATGGWFHYYVLSMPSAHGINLKLVQDVLTYDVALGFVLIGITIAYVALGARRALRGDRRDLLLAALLAAGGATALSSRLHVGGWVNVLQFWTSVACSALAVLGARVDAWLATRPFQLTGELVFSALLLTQLGLWVRSPQEGVPDMLLRADTERFLQGVGRLERLGDVLVVGRGHVTKQPHFQMSALADVYRTSGAPADVLDALRERRLAAIVDDAREEDGPPLGELWPATMLEDVPAAKALLFANYFVAATFDDRSLRLAMTTPAFARWTYRPRRAPLALPEAEIERRHFAEMKLAEQRSDALRHGDRAPFAEADIEELAARAGAIHP